MIAPQLVTAADGVAASSNPESDGYGYTDTQLPWHYAPAIALERNTAHHLLQVLADHLPRDGRCLLGADEDRVAHTRLLRLVAADVVDIDESNSPPCHAALLTARDLRSDWLTATARVLPGGLVALLDSSQTLPGAETSYDHTTWIAEFERNVLQPAGVRLHRIGSACAIYYYIQPTDPLPTDVTPPAQNDSAAAEPPASTALQAAWSEVQPHLVQARADLEAGRIDAARQQVLALRASYPGLGDDLCARLRWEPHRREVLLDAGTLELFGPLPAKGTALLRQAFEQNMMNRGLLQTLSRCYLEVLNDTAAAKRLADAVRRQVRRRDLARVCHTELTGNVLWQYPRLLEPVFGVLQVGAHTGEHVAAWQRLGIGNQCYVEANPDALAALRHKVADGSNTVILSHAVSDRDGPQTLHVCEDSAFASLLTHHPLAASPAPNRRPTRSLEVPCRTLDGLAQDGAFATTDYNLLFVNTEGTELDVLRGAATTVLPHMDLICVAVYLEPVYDGAPLPQQVQSYLRSLDDGFGLCAFEPVVDPAHPERSPARGHALFRRLERRKPQ